MNKEMRKQIEKYSLFELKLKVLEETALMAGCAVFENENEQIQVSAFRNRRNEYIVRFMPDREGTWNYYIFIAGNERQGTFECVANQGKNQGRVITKGHHFQYEDGEKFIPFGTTAYAWIHQTAELRRQTIETLANSPFNKIRMCVFPKSMPYNTNDPDSYPFEKKADGTWDVNNPEPEFWEKLDKSIEELMNLGIEADLILFHPYDRWGFAELSQKDSLIYLEYVITRLSAYRNLWWSLANEYEILYSKSLNDWNEYGELILKKDIYGHLRSVHNILDPFPKRTWLTHCSIQSSEMNKIPVWRQEYDLPIIIDECGYEGDLPYSWGSLTAFEMAHRFWWSMCRGGFCTHGETYHREDEVLWWAKGGKLYGESEKRIEFLKNLLYSLPGEWQMPEYKGMNPNLDEQDEKAVREAKMFQKALEHADKATKENFVAFTTPMKIEGEGYSLEYFGHVRPAYLDLNLKEETEHKVEIVDIWEMTRRTAAEKACGKMRIKLPAKEGIALLIMEKQHKGW